MGSLWTVKIFSSSSMEVRVNNSDGLNVESYFGVKLTVFKVFEILF
jgi:hypothetical protein